MAAKGKVNASKVQINDRIIVLVSQASGNVTISGTKTGEGVTVARVTGKLKAIGARGYFISTNLGRFYAESIQTMWLAPEDPAGIKRAHVEALAEDAERRRVPLLIEDAQAPAEDAQAPAEDAEALPLDAERWARAKDEENREHEDGCCELAAEVADFEPRSETHGSTVVRLLERVWARIRHDHPDLPEVVIVTGAGIPAGKWGHFRADGWSITAREEGDAEVLRKSVGHMHEMFMAGETLARGAAQVLQTMLHEGAHTLARVRDLKDTSRQGRWHNQTFRKLAGEMGLHHPTETADKTHGFAFVQLTDETRERYADLLSELDKEIRLVIGLPGWLGGDENADERGGEKIAKPKGGESKSNSSGIKATCECEDPLIIRLSRKVLDLGTVRCDRCAALFTEA